MREMTQAQLARETDIPQARLSRIETGQVEASSVDLDALAQILGLPSGFFLEPGAPAAAPIFRKRAIRSARRLSGIQARINIAVLAAQRLIDAGVDIDPPRYLPEPGQFAPDEPAEAASALRRDWRLPAGPVDDVCALVEATAGIVLRVDFGTSDASAAFVPTPDGRVWFLLNTRETAGDRLRLSLAHELGHAVLHRMLPTHDESEFEDQAFAFATALLLPSEFFDSAIPYDALTLSKARELKEVFGVSMQAIIRAAFDRDRITRSRYTSLFKQLSARRWRTVEPDPIEMETPELWDAVLRVHRVNHGYSDADFGVITRVGQDVLAELFPESFSSTRRSLHLVPPQPQSSLRPA
jgi:Zn-dependent peptidase ImmA (M78 family)